MSMLNITVLPLSPIFLIYLIMRDSTVIDYCFILFCGH